MEHNDLLFLHRDIAHGLKIGNVRASFNHDEAHLIAAAIVKAIKAMQEDSK